MDDSGCGCYLSLTLFLSIAAILFGVAVSSDDVSPFDITQSTSCTIQTTETDVRVRIGPGTHREVYQFLPAERPFAVLGQATSDDRVWWQIQGYEGIQAWVDSADVTAAGDCTQVAELEAPPIILPASTATPEPSSTPTPVIEGPPDTSGQQSTATPPPATQVPATEIPATEMPATEAPATEMPEPSPVSTDECDWYPCDGTGEDD